MPLKKFRELKPSLMLIVSFITAIIVGTILLLLPISTVQGKISLIDALFTSTSAVCVTGLIVVDTATYFTTFGKTVIMLLFQLGGLGIMTFTTLIIFVAKKDFSFSEKTVIENSFSTKGGLNLKKFLRDVFLFTISMEIIGTIFLYYGVFSEGFNNTTGLFHSIFHSISAFNNAGFSTFTLSLENYSRNPVLNITVVFLIIIGGIGFFVIRDIWHNLKNKNRKFTLHSKLVFITTFILIIMGIVLFFILEQNNSLAGKTNMEKFFISLFQSVTPRTAGFNTIDMNLLSPATILFIISLMVIGASPGSTGGGMKTTTWAAQILFLRAKLRRKENVQAIGRNISWEIIDKVNLLLLFSVAMIFTGTFLITIVDGNKFSVLQILFEVVSAYGTVGLSLGITSTLSDFSKLIIIVIMYTGRIGILNILYAFVTKKTGAKFEYPAENIIVG